MILKNLKFIIPVLALFLISKNSVGQYSFHIQAGINETRALTKTPILTPRKIYEQQESSTEMGFTLGIQCQRPFFENYILATALNFSKKKVRKNEYVHGNFNQISGFVVTQQYLEIPILARMKLEKNLQLGLGLGTNILLNSKLTNTTTHYHEPKAIKTVDPISIGELLYHKNKIEIGCRYTRGFNNKNIKVDAAWKDAEFNYNDNSTIILRQHDIRFYIGYKI